MASGDKIAVLMTDGSSQMTKALPLAGGHGKVNAASTHAEIMAVDDETNYRTFHIRKGSYVALKDAAAVVEMADGNAKAYNLYGEHNKPSAADVGALPSSIVMLSEVNVPKNWTDIWAMGCGVYSWVQSEVLAWEPGDTPSGAIRVVLEIMSSGAGSYTARLRYIDGVTMRTEFIGEADGTVGRWAKVYTSANLTELRDALKAIW